MEIQDNLCVKSSSISNMPHMMSEQWFEKKSTLINSAAMSSSFAVQETIFTEPKDVDNIKKGQKILSTSL